MIRKPEHCLTEERKGMCGGSGVVKVRNFVSNDELLGNGRLFAETTLDPGCSVGVHEHVGDSEIYYILEGEAVYTDDNEEVTVKAGDIAICRPNHSHGIANKSDHPCKFIALILFERD